MSHPSVQVWCTTHQEAPQFEIKTRSTHVVRRTFLVLKILTEKKKKKHKLNMKPVSVISLE